MALTKSIDMIGRLVSFDTTSRFSNMALIAFIQDYLDGFGIASELTFDDDRQKANLFATISPKAAGGTEQGGIVLSGHTDVVPVDGQNWQSDPFTLAERDERLYGRGTADMKSFIAVTLAKLPELVALPLKTPLHLAFTYDEEVGCLGVPRLLAGLAARALKPRCCIIGEPTLMRSVTGHKGKKAVRCHVHGHPAHSSLTHEGVNAIEAAAELVAYMKQIARRFRDQGPFDADYVPPYTTVHTGRIEGGTILNIVPRDCVFDYEFRYLPLEDPEKIQAEIEQYAATKILPEMRAVHAKSGFDFQDLSNSPGLATPEDHWLTQLVLSLTGINATGKVSFGTEGGLYQDSGIPTIICGPGSIEQAHKPDEWIGLDQIAACERFIDRIADHACHA